MSEERLLRVFNWGTKQRDIYYRYTTLARQIGRLGDALNYWDVAAPERKAPYLEEVKTHLADIMVQTRVMCLLLCLDWAEIWLLGVERLDEGERKFKGQMLK